MAFHGSGGGSIAQPQQFQTLPTAVIFQAEQHDRDLKTSELKTLENFFKSGAKRIEVATILAQHANEIVAAGADRIFFNGSPMDYLEPPANREEMPGYTTPQKENSIWFQTVKQVQPANRLNLVRDLLKLLQIPTGTDHEPLPGGFHLINIARYGPQRMKRSMRDLDWFLRYVTYAIVAGDPSILTVNVRGLRGVIPEDVTEATVIALKEMRRRSLRYFKQDAEAQTLIQAAFDQMIADYLVEKPPNRLRIGVSNEQQGLVLPESYALSATSRSRFVMKPHLSAIAKQAVIQAVYRQLFERDITREYGVSFSELESRFKSGELSTKEFVRCVGKSRFYRREFYEPFSMSRAIELAVRHFLGRGLSSMEEFQQYFEIVTQGGFLAVIDALIDTPEYADYFGEETVPYLRGLGQEAQECRNWGAQQSLFKYSAGVHKLPQFLTVFGNQQQPLPNQHAYGPGNDVLETQFGAVFPQTSWQAIDRPAPATPDQRRILISCFSGNGSHEAMNWGQVPGTVPPIKFTALRHDKSIGHQGASINLAKQSPDAVIEAVYRQLFGHEVFAEQRSLTAETKLRGNEISLREFVRQLAKSRSFRQMYWERLYITKAIEAIHRRLLGRPTWGRSEMGRYYDICANQGFYALIDEMVDSADYLEAFGEDTIPFERYVTPRGYELRSRSATGNLRLPHDRKGSTEPEPRVADESNSWMQAAIKKMRYSTTRQSLAIALTALKPLSVEVLEAAKQLQLESDTPDGMKVATSTRISVSEEQ